MSLAITHEGKTYEWNQDPTKGIEQYGAFFIKGIRMSEDCVQVNIDRWRDTLHTPEQLVKLGYLEEIKKNKYSSIEKLKEELERRINSEEWSTPYQEIKRELEDLRDFLTSLEQPGEELRDEEGFTKEAGDRLLKDSNDPENTITGVFNNSKDLIDNLNKISWTPTPGQMIEVSDNKIEWYPAKYEGVSKDKDYPISTKNNQGWYKYARPLQTDKIEELSEWDYEKIEETIEGIEFEKIDECRHMVGRIGKQLELLTKTLNQVIRKIK